MKNSNKTLFWLVIFLALALRIVFLDRIPSSLYTDEVDQGYNAYSIMKTGRDEHGAILPVSLRSFGDWKPPLQTYLMIPFIYIFGLNETSVRLPSVLLGLGTIVLSYYLVKELFRDYRKAEKLALLVSFFLAISPWHLLQSRSAMLVVISLFFLEGGILFFVKGLNNSKYYILSSVFFVLSIYAYYGLRVVAPLIFLVLVLINRKQINFRQKEIILSMIIGLLMTLPLILSFINNPDVVFGRARTVSVFYDQGTKLRQWELISQDGAGASRLISRLFHNNLVMFGRNIIQRFLIHLDGRYLVVNGDHAPPFQIPNMGIIYPFDFFLIIIGLIVAYKRKFSSRNLLLWWLVISIIPAAFTYMTPAANRTFNAIIPFMVFLAIGLLSIFKKGQVFRPLIFSLIFSVSFAYFLRQYFLVLPADHADWWNGGMKETAKYVLSVSEKYDNVVFLDKDGMPYIYLLFYGKIDPNLYQKMALRNYHADEFGFERIEEYGKYLFPDNRKWQDVKNNLQPKTLYVVPAKDTDDGLDYLHEIRYPNGKLRYKLFGSR